MTSIIVKYWVEFAMGVIAAGLTVGFKYLCKRQKETDAKQKAIGNGVKALLRDRIIQASNYCRNKGYCSVFDLENMEDLYLEYKSLGGNGAITAIIEEMRAMPREKKKEER